jgi:cobalt-zinc-cadmium efflux system outer membrane protein
VKRILIALVLYLLSVPVAKTQEASRVRFGADGLKLTDLADRVVGVHPSVLAARERASAARGLHRQAGLRPNPILDADVSTTRLFVSEDEGERSVGISQTFELGGKRARRVEVADFDVQLAESLAAEVARRVRADVLTSCVEAISAHRQFAVLDEQLQVSREMLRLTEARAREGEVAPLEADLVRVEVLRLEGQRALAEAGLGRVLAEVERLVPREMLPVTLTDHIETGELVVSETDLRDRALTERPDLRAARLRAQQANGQVRLAQAQRIPDIVGGVHYIRETSAFENVLGTGQEIRSTDNLLALKLSIPLPFLNRNQGNIEAARAGERADRQESTATEWAVGRDVGAAYSGYRAARQATQIFRKEAVEQAQKNLEVMREAYRLGQLRLLDVLNEQRKAIDLRLIALDAERELGLSGVALEAAVGHSLGLIR